MQSVRQQHQPPSDTVLDHALSAVLGAIWIDCERQERTSSYIRSTILEVLRTIDAIVDQHSATADCVTGVDGTPDLQRDTISDAPGRQFEMTELDRVDDVDTFTREWFQQELNDFSPDLVLHENLPPESQSFVSQPDCAVSLHDHLVDDIEMSGNWSLAFEGAGAEPHTDRPRYERQDRRPLNAPTEQTPPWILHDVSSHTTLPVKRAKRKRIQDENEKSGCAYQKMLQAEQNKLMRYSQVDQQRLSRFLKHPVLDKQEIRGSVLVRFLYLTIGSWETIVDFQDLIQIYRNNASVYRVSNVLSRDAAVVYNEICRLDKEEALCVLLRRYYIIKLCEEGQLYNDHHSHIIVETPKTVDAGRVAKPGNPIFALDSSLTERLLLKIMPDTDPKSADYQKARVKVKRLRKLAGHLRHLVKRYGVGILCLLPSGPSFRQMSVTDNMCVNLEIILHR